MIERAARRGDVAPGPSALTWRENRFFRYGNPTQVLSGSLHYFRVHPAQWRDRLQRLVDMGLNTVDTYVAWNFHQPTKDAVPDFSGWRDLEAFLRIAQDLGLDAIVRPGPYICAEWSNGALPAWLTAATGFPRTDDPSYLKPVMAWFDELLPRLVPLQAAQGGPIVAVQVENEFGSFGDDTDHLRTLVRALHERGISELLFTADGPTELMLDSGAVDGILSAITMGSRAESARELARTRRPDEPFFAAEYWNGWFDHWGSPHHVRDADSAAQSLGEIIADGGSVSIYMAHGGTNFGLWAGANRVDGELRGTTTSYDSDAPIAEDGTLTRKFHVMREVLGATKPIVSAQPRLVQPTTVAATHVLDLAEALDVLSDAPVHVRSTSTFESLGVDGGLVRYTTEVRLPAEEIELTFTRVGDRAHVRIDGELRATITEQGAITVTGTGEIVNLDVLVENLGRVNYGHTLGEEKGLLGPVLVGRRMIQHWQANAIPLVKADVARLAGPVSEVRDRAGIAVSEFELHEALDAHLALPGFVHGFVWVNGFLLGRYWDIGPQKTLYIPEPLLRPGRNEILILELERRGDHVELRDHPSLGPEEQYVETF